MSQPLDFLSDSDVRQISSLVDTLDRSNFDYLQVDVGNMKVTIGKGPLPTGGVLTSAAPQPAAALPAASPAAAPAAAAATPAPSATVGAPAAPAAAAQPGWSPVTATTMGRFYSRPDPKSPPFIKVGDKVKAEDTIGLIEVMKLFNAIPAGVAGTVVEICVDDAAVVEFGQVLMYLKA